MNAHIERMARDVGCVIGDDGPDCQFEVSFNRTQLEAFARLIAEDCASITEDSDCDQQEYHCETMMRSAQAIRERYK